MTEELKQLQQAIDGLDGADEFTKTAIQWLIMDINHYIKKPTDRCRETVKQGIDSYQESWINWKAKQ